MSNIFSRDYEMNTSIHLIPILLFFSLSSPSLKTQNYSDSPAWPSFEPCADGLYRSSSNHPSAFEAWFTEVTFLSYNSNLFSQAVPGAVTLRRKRHDRVNVSVWTGLPAWKLKRLPARCELQVNLLSVRGEYRGCAFPIMLSRGKATAQKGREKQKCRRKKSERCFSSFNTKSGKNMASTDRQIDR